jgi:serralysin
MSGGNDADYLEGGTGADTLSGDAGNDTLLGGDGNDRLFGGAESDQLSGGNNADLLEGGSGNDTLLGDAGADTLAGDAGNDSLDGGTENDLLQGGTGNDTLRGGAGYDSVFGGDDRDTILYADGDAAGNATLRETVDGGNGGDDFDTLDLSGYGWSRLEITYDSPGSENGDVIFYAANGTTEVGRLRFTEIENVIPCFTPGTMIDTPTGPRPVESLLPGDLVLTRDCGAQPIRWVGRRDLSRGDLLRNTALRPVVLAAGVLGPGLPNRDMMVSPQHRILFDGPRCQLLFGETEVLVPALQLCGRSGVGRSAAATAYIHLMFDCHQIIRSDGVWTESFQPGDNSLGAIDADQRDELLALFPQLVRAGAYPAAHASLRSHEARVLLDA